MVTRTSTNYKENESQIVVTEVQAALPRNPVCPSGSEGIYQAV